MYLHYHGLQWSSFAGFIKFIKVNILKGKSCFWISENVTRIAAVFLSIHCLCLQEFSLEKAMRTMFESWDDITFHHQSYRESDVSILTTLDEIQTLLDDQIVKTQTMRGSPFIKPLENEIKVCDKFFEFTWR